MSGKCSIMGLEEPDLNAAGTLPTDDVVQQTTPHASTSSRPERKPKSPDNEIPTKKRKTRRGKSKRKQPYNRNNRKATTMVKPEAPHNSNEFLLEDHGAIELDEKLKCADQVSTSTLTRTRDSSFSVDSDGEFYSSPDDEEQYLIKDFDDQYNTLQAERLNSMSKNELINEYLLLESKLETLSKTSSKKSEEAEDTRVDRDTERAELQSEIERLKIENEHLKLENEQLRIRNTQKSDSEDSETDSSDSCNSSTSNSTARSLSRSPSPESSVEPDIDYSLTNGHASPPAVDLN